MSRDKTRNEARRLELLAEAERSGGLFVNCIGGIGIDQPDLRRLRRDGLVRIVRLPKDHALAAYSRTTRAIITDKGKALLSSMAEPDA